MGFGELFAETITMTWAIARSMSTVATFVELYKSQLVLNGDCQGKTLDFPTPSKKQHPENKKHPFTTRD